MKCCRATLGDRGGGPQNPDLGGDFLHKIELSTARPADRGDGCGIHRCGAGGDAARADPPVSYLSERRRTACPKTGEAISTTWAGGVREGLVSDLKVLPRRTRRPRIAQSRARIHKENAPCAAASSNGFVTIEEIAEQ